MNSIRNFDYSLFEMINQAGLSFWDPIMLLLSNKWVWIPLYAFLLVKLYNHYKKDIWLPLILIGLIITSSDQLTSSLMKPYFQRPRPCHDQNIEQVSLVNDYCGGQYGFPSSHASNTMALAVFIASIWGFRSKLSLAWIFWSICVGYSRVYLGVHFPGDVMGGFLIGGIISVVAVTLIHTRLRVSRN